MKSIFICNIKSFVDIITNSSSEIFVCSGSKEKEAVEQILKELLKNYNNLTGESYNYEDCIGSIDIAKYSFDIYAVPFDILENYQKYAFVSGRASYFEDLEYRGLQQEEEKAKIEFGVVEDLYAKDPEKYRKLNNKWFQSKERKEIWKNYNKKSKNAELAMFKWFLKYNEIEGDLKAFEKSFLEMTYIPSISTNKLDQAYREMSHLVGYNIKIKKGQIIIKSKGDNTIPYELFGPIESHLNAERHHIG
jgi:hypothetical protein